MTQEDKIKDKGIAFGKLYTKEGDGFWNWDFHLLPSITIYLNGYKHKKGINDFMLTFSWLLWYIQIYSFKNEDRF